MKSRRVFEILIALILALCLGWWIFRDTYRKYGVLIWTGEDVRFAHFGESEDVEFWRQTIEDFEQINREVRISQEYVAGASDQYLAKLRQQVQSQTLPDVMLVQLTAFRELSEHFEFVGRHVGGLAPTGLKAFEVRGEQRGVPFAGGSLLIFVNRQSLQRASAFHGKAVAPPDEDWTVAQFLQTAEALTCDFGRDGQTDQFGFQLPQWSNFLPFIWSFGADFTNEQATQWTFVGPAAQSAMRFYRQLATGDRVVPREEEVSPLPLGAAFLAGKTAMCVNGPWFAAILDKTELAGEYVVAPIPRGPGGRTTSITWDGLVMRKNLTPERRAWAMRFIAWTVSKNVQWRFARLGRAVPARVDVQEEYVAADRLRRKPFIDALSDSRLQPAMPQFESIDRAIGQHFADAADPDRAFAAAAVLEALARHPDVVGAFSQSEPGSP